MGYDNPPSYNAGGNYNYNDNANNNYNYDANNNSDVQQAPPDRDYRRYDNDNPNPVTGNVAATTPTVLIYLSDGTTLAASDYWLADGQLHYYVNYGGENSVDMSQVDLQRTVNENAKRGVRFSLKPNPDSANPVPSSNDYRPRYENKPRTPNTNPNNNPNSTTSNQNNNKQTAPATNPAPPAQPEPRMETTSQTTLSHS
jgi:hypothetical protein